MTNNERGTTMTTTEVANVVLPSGPFSVVVADPPWQYNPSTTAASRRGGKGGRAEWHYPTMTNQEIANLPVSSIVADDAHLFLWVTNPRMFGGRYDNLSPKDIAEAWAFEYRTLLTWVKTTKAGAPMRGGLGFYFRGCTEHVLYCTRGKARITEGLREANVIMAPRGRRSEKPQVFFDMVDRVVPGGARLEIFARHPRPGWSVWGDEIQASSPTTVPTS